MPNSYTKQRIAFFLFCFLLGSLAFSQTSSLSLSSGSAVEGGSVSLNLSLSASGGAPAGLQWTLSFVPTDATSVVVAAGAALSGASKTLTCNSVSGSVTCMAIGATDSTIGNGVVATVTVTLSPATSGATVPIAVSKATAAFANGSSLANGSTETMSAVSGAITVTNWAPALSSLSCSPTSLGSGAKSTCTVSLAQAAPSGGTAVSLASNNTMLPVPASVTVPAGSTSATSTATAGNCGTNQTATVTATLNSASKAVVISLMAPVQVSSLTCSPTSLGQSSSSICTITLTQAAPTGGASVALSSNAAALTVPATATVAAGSATATFSATSGTISSNQTATVTATYNSTSATAGISLTVTVRMSSLSCNPTGLGQSSSSICTITLTQVAPTGGASVALSSNAAALTVPATVTVAAGSATATFSATSGTISSNQTATVTATYNSTSATASISLTAPVQVSSLSCSPASLGPNSSTTCTTTLNQAAPSGGASVTLSSNSTMLSVAASVTVPAGSTSANSTATAGNCNSNQTATLTATLSGVSKIASISLVAPVQVSSLSCSPTSLGQDSSSTCTITLNQAAPSGGASITLSSNAAALTVPATVTVAAGSATATFGATSGTISSNQTATVTATYNTSATASITLTAPATVTGVSPNSGSTAGGTTVTITGTSFAAGATVTFGGTAASGVVVVNSTTITAATPAGTAGAVTVTVMNPGAQSGSLAAGFTYVVPTSTTITYVQGNFATPQTASTTVSIAFTAAQVAGDLNVIAVGWNDSKAVVSAVTDSKGNKYALAVGPTVQSGYATQSIYYAKNIAAAVAGANTVTVTFASAATAPDIRILEYSGADPSNPVDVTVATTGSSATSSSGAVTTTNANDLLFGANLVQTSTTAPCSGFTKRLLTTPDGDIAEDEMVKTAGSYTATAPVSPSGDWIMQMVAFRTPTGGTVLPTVTSVSPNSGPTAGGTAVTIIGTNFAAGATVTFGATAAANVVVTSGTTITATTPAGSAGAVSVTVTANGQSGSLVSGFSYSLPPTLTSVSPNSGSTAGGTAVTITGTNFAAGATVTFAGAAAANVVAVSGTEITATTPAGSAGAVTVTVTNPAAQSVSLADGFTYVVEATATPTLVSHVSESNSRSSAVTSPYHLYLHLADPATAGNAIVVACQFQGEPTLTITDNKSDSYKNAEVYYNSANNQSIVIAEAFNVAAGAYNLTATWSAETSQFACVSSQIANVIAADGAGAGNEGSGTSATAGSMTPTASGDMVYQVVASLSGRFAQKSFTAGSQSNIAWNLESADLEDGMAVQSGVYSSTSAIDPAMTQGTSATWISAAVLLKSGTTGAVPTGMRVAYEIHENFPYTPAAGGTGNAYTSPAALQIPCIAGATIAALMDGGGATNPSLISSITDSNGNTWSQIAQYVYSNDGVYAQAYYAKNVACSSGFETLKVTFADTTNDDTIVFYVIPGAGTSPLDTYSGSAQDISSAGSPVTLNYTLTPAAAGEIVIAEENWYYNTATGTPETNWLFDSSYYSGIVLDGPQPIDQNGGWMHYYTTSTSPLSFTYNMLSSSDANGPAAGMAVAFK